MSTTTPGAPSPPSPSSPSSPATPTTNKCPICSEPARMLCKACRSIHYCSREHQVEHWGEHKPACKAIQKKKAAADAEDQKKADSYTAHKAEFDRIRLQYGLEKEEKASEISELLTTGSVSAAEFATRFGMSNEDAVIFLEWIQVGVRFKEENLDKASAAMR